MTKVGIQRRMYAELVEPAPSIFSESYEAWARRADDWAEKYTVIESATDNEVTVKFNAPPIGSAERGVHLHVGENNA